MQPAVSYILYTTSSHEQTGDIITFLQFEEGNLVGNELNTEEDEPILSSIYELSTDDDSDDRSISTNALKDIWGGSQIHPGINARCTTFKIRYLIKHPQNEWKGAELSTNRMGKGLHKSCKGVVNESNNALANL